MAQLALAREEHWNTCPPAGFETGVAIDVDLVHSHASGLGERSERCAHFVAEVAVGAHQQRQAQGSAASLTADGLGPVFVSAAASSRRYSSLLTFALE